jgi:hypothetical protein
MPEEMPGMDIQRTAPVEPGRLAELLQATEIPRHVYAVQGGVEIYVTIGMTPEKGSPRTAQYHARVTMPWDLAWEIVSISPLKDKWGLRSDAIRNDALPRTDYAVVSTSPDGPWPKWGAFQSPEDVAEHLVAKMRIELLQGWAHFEPHYRHWLVCRAVMVPRRDPAAEDPGEDFGPLL